MEIATLNSNKHKRSADSEDLSILSSDEEIDIKEEGKVTILGNGISNHFTLYVNTGITGQSENGEQDKGVESESATPSNLDSKQRLARQIEQFKMAFHSIKLFVWPTFRLPTGSSVIALINTSFLFATKRLEQERLEADFLVALSLISGRKFI